MSVLGFKDEPWFEKSFTALKAEWEGSYQTDEDITHLWVDEMKFYFKKFDARTGLS